MTYSVEVVDIGGESKIKEKRNLTPLNVISTTDFDIDHHFDKQKSLIDIPSVMP